MNNSRKQSVKKNFFGKPCAICGLPPTTRMTIDHIVPRSRGDQIAEAICSQHTKSVTD